MESYKVGILGAGQLGAMLAEAADGLGFICKFYNDSENAPAGRFGPVVVGSFTDRAKLEQFASNTTVATYEFENVPASAVEILSPKVPVFPPLAALKASQDRIAEKNLFTELGIRTTEYLAVDSLEDLNLAIAKLGCPLVLKTRTMGYDGKGQAVLTSAAAAAETLSSLGGKGLIAEQFIRFNRELSLIAVAARTDKVSGKGDFQCYPLVQNEHRAGILRLTRAPAPEISSSLQKQATDAAGKIISKLGYVGVLTIEFFECDGTLVANEMAPRVHNSGHWTIEGAECSQFENHIRAICNLPLGSTALSGFSGMVNIIGEVPAPESETYKNLLAVNGVHLHLYHKSSAPGRKVGHVTITAPTLEEREERLEAICKILKN